MLGTATPGTSPDVTESRASEEVAAPNNSGSLGEHVPVEVLQGPRDENRQRIAAQIVED
jgi:hypothetical protein